MFDITIIGKNKPNCIILIHGLFSHPGFWLKYLHFFKGSCLVLVSVNYNFLLNIDEHIRDLRRDLSQILAHKTNKKLIAHSLGSFVALKLGNISNILSYHICPVYSADRRNRDEFIDLVCATQSNLNRKEICEILRTVNLKLELDTKVTKKIEIDQLQIYVPNIDIFFEYYLTGNEIFFEGDHFNIHSALKKLSQN